MTTVNINASTFETAGQTAATRLLARLSHQNHAVPPLWWNFAKDEAASNPTTIPSPTDASSTEIPESAESRPLLLLVEDNRADVFLVKKAIEFHQVPVRLEVVEDGEEAVKYFENVDADANVKCPKMILLDLNLPKRSGNEVLKRVRTGTRCAHIPVIILTSSDSYEDRERTKRLGANRYFRKPTSYNDFLRIGEVLNEFLDGQTH